MAEEGQRDAGLVKQPIGEAGEAWLLRGKGSPVGVRPSLTKVDTEDKGRGLHGSSRPGKVSVPATFC